MPKQDITAYTIAASICELCVRIAAIAIGCIQMLQVYAV